MSPVAEVADGDSDSDGYQPFASLFARLKPINAQPKAKQAAQPKPKSKARAATNKASSRESTAKQPRVVVDPDTMQSDDKEIVNKFSPLVIQLKVLDPPSHDEAGFTKWSKERVQALQDLRNQIYTKYKSLKRRKDTSVELTSSLEATLDDLASLSELLRKLAAGNPEGKHMYEKLEQMDDVQACPAIWLRAVRAAAFEDLKFMHFQQFFVQTHSLCKKHDNQEPGFFPMLASQLLQRLVKALQLPKGGVVVAETVGNIKNFVDVMVDESHIHKTQPDDIPLDKHTEVMLSLKSILDFSSPPKVVLNSLQIIKSSSQHWAAMVFVLPQGKKIIEAASLNATNKESLEGVLGVLKNADSFLHKSGLCTINAAFSVGLKSCFDGDHGDQMSALLSDLSAKEFKVLKGADKDKLSRVQALSHRAVEAIVFAAVQHDVIPYMRTLLSGISNGDAIDTGIMMLNSESALLHLSDKCGHGQEVLLERFKDLSDFANSMVAKLCGSAPELLSDRDVRSLHFTWGIKATLCADALGTCASKAQEACPDATQNVQELLCQFQTTTKEVDEAIKACLKNHLTDKSHAGVQECFAALMKVVRSNGADVSDDAVQDFRSKSESAGLVSTVLGEEEGAIVRTAIEAASLLFSCAVEYGVHVADVAASTSGHVQTLEFIKHELKLSQVDCVGAVQSLRAKVQVVDDGDVSCMQSLMDAMRKVRETEYGQIVHECHADLNSAFVEDAVVEIPEDLAKIDTYEGITKAFDQVRQHFSVAATKDISQKAEVLENCIRNAKKVAEIMDVPVENVVNLAKYEASYRSMIRWLVTGNVFVCLQSKAVTRAWQSGTKIQQKALSALQSAVKTASDYDTELPAGIQAVVTKVTQMNEVVKPAM